MVDRRARGDGNHGRQGGRENESRRVAAHGIDDCSVGGNVSAERAESFGERGFDDIDAIQETFALSDPSSPRAVQANRVNLVDIGERIVSLGQLHDLADRSDVAVHRIKAFENDHFHAIATRLDQQLLEMRDIIVPPDFLFAT